jgi:hypothetical protein
MGIIDGLDRVKAGRICGLQRGTACKQASGWAFLSLFRESSKGRIEAEQATGQTGFASCLLARAEIK